MFYSPAEMTRKVDSYLEQQRSISTLDPFAELMQAIAEKEKIGQGQEDFDSFHLPFLKGISANDLAKDDGILLLSAADKAQHHTIGYLLQETDQWPQDALKQAALCASSKGYDMTMRAVLKGLPDMNGSFFQQLLDCAADSDMRSTLESFRREALGEGWRINDEYEIQRKTEYPTLVHVFNFGACHVTTIIPGGEKGQQVIQRDFKDLQNDGELEIAYAKLQKFTANPPPYRGKDTSATRRIQKRERTARNV
ncbi:MAG: hypothetical protein EP349_05780 [Alphaproteobacteria bacterium]|nr:MAG: hypothetical protein EP349_05780 [Alphaproteobacteria bacterium]